MSGRFKTVKLEALRELKKIECGGDLARWFIDNICSYWDIGVGEFILTKQELKFLNFYLRWKNLEKITIDSSHCHTDDEGYYISTDKIVDEEEAEEYQETVYVVSIKTKGRETQYYNFFEEGCIYSFANNIDKKAYDYWKKVIQVESTGVGEVPIIIRKV